jgi:hypothetical protein
MSLSLNGNYRQSRAALAYIFCCQPRRGQQRFSLEPQSDDRIEA